MRALHTALLIVVIMAAVTFYVSQPSAAHLIIGALFAVVAAEVVTVIWMVVRIERMRFREDVEPREIKTTKEEL
jgi:membrane protein YdbS with pleckstrin-like domain